MKLKFFNYILFITILLSSCNQVEDYKPNDEKEKEQQEKPNSYYTKKAVIEDYTGSWCGYCPRITKAIEMVKDKTNKVIPIGVHIGDQMQVDVGVKLKDNFSINFYPNAFLDRKNRWISPETANIDQVLDLVKNKTDLGLAIETKLSGNKLQVKIKVGFSNDYKSVNLVVFLLESDLIYYQINYTSYYAGNVINDFKHDHVLRHAFTDVMGESLDGSKGIKSKDYKMDDISKMIKNAKNAEIVAMIVQTSSEGKKVLNAQVVKVGKNKDFDLE